MSSQQSINLNCMASDSKQMETSEDNYMYCLTSLYRETVKLMFYISFSVDKYLNYFKSTCRCTWKSNYCNEYLFRRPYQRVDSKEVSWTLPTIILRIPIGILTICCIIVYVGAEVLEEGVKGWAGGAEQRWVWIIIHRSLLNI